MARLTGEVDLGEGRSVKVQELAIGEYRQMLAGSKQAMAGMTIDQLLGDGFIEVAKSFLPFTDLKPEDIDGLTPSEIKLIGAKIKELNPDFFAMLGGLQGVLAILKENSKNSMKPVQGSSNGVM